MLHPLVDRCETHLLSAGNFVPMDRHPMGSYIVQLYEGYNFKLSSTAVLVLKDQHMMGSDKIYSSKSN